MILLDGGGNGHFGLVGWRWERTLWSCGVEVGTDTLVLWSEGLQERAFNRVGRMWERTFDLVWWRWERAISYCGLEVDDLLETFY